MTNATPLTYVWQEQWPVAAYLLFVVLFHRLMLSGSRFEFFLSGGIHLLTSKTLLSTPNSLLSLTAWFAREVSENRLRMQRQ